MDARTARSIKANMTSGTYSAYRTVAECAEIAAKSQAALALCVWLMGVPDADYSVGTCPATAICF